MKLLVVITQDRNVPDLLEAMAEREYGVTKLASTGGFLRQGNTTLITGIEDQQVTDAVALVEQLTEKATVFVLDVERFEKL